MSSKSEREFETLLDYLKRNRGFDFTGYKRPSLVRRIRKRMDAVDVEGYAAYQDYLEVHPEEFAALINTILINVTAFFRDEAAWHYLAEHVLPRILEGRGAREHIRVWSAGCASGEEAYSLAMLLAERVGIKAFRDRVKVYATDVDEEALTKARHGTYSESEVADIPEHLRKKYFDIVESNYVFRKDLRCQVIFGRHDLINDAPISRVDLLVCRNTLMYLNAETKARILARFHFALNDGGILFLGRAETLLTQANTFQPIDLKHRISTKVSHGRRSMRDRLLLTAHAASEDTRGNAAHDFRLREMAIDAFPLAHLVVDAAGMLALANERARSLFGVAPADIGRPLQDIKVSYRPVELRSLIEQARLEHRIVMVRDIEWSVATGDTRYFDVQVLPLTDAGAYAGASVSFADISSTKRLHRDLERARQELETAYEEVQSTNEELETTNEELQSTVEELETTNEELQSTNEELETMNEELQSTNEELTTMNDELRDRSDELSRVNLFLESVLSSIRGAVVVVDPEMHVAAWSRGAREIWGLREDEVVGKHFLGLEIGLPVSDLRQPLRHVLSSDDGDCLVELKATNRRGRPIRVRVSVSHLKEPMGKMHGAILVMEELEELPAAAGS